MKTLKIIILFFSLLNLLSCSKQLNEKSNKSLVVPETVADLQALLNNESLNTGGYPAHGEVFSDNYWTNSTLWSAQSEDNRKRYLWDSDPNALVLALGWNACYENTLIANVVLDHINKVTSPNTSLRNDVKGQALFLRAWCFYNVVSLWTMPYDKANAGQQSGIPLRLSSDINTPSSRATLQESYQQIIDDLKEAAALLPTTISFKTRASKPAAYSLLVRTYLAMQDYQNVEKYADSALSSYDTLASYTDYSASATAPIAEKGKEVIYDARATGSTNNQIIHYTVARVDTTLYRSYTNDDLRKSVFFAVNGDGSYYFKGNYSGSRLYPLFIGLASDELYLAKAEASARAGNKTVALQFLNKLLKTRWKANTYIDKNAATAQDALDTIMVERRKELLYRTGLRWSDIRRLSSDIRYNIVPKRIINNQTYTLPINDLRYALLIPQQVINTTGIQQNAR